MKRFAFILAALLPMIASPPVAVGAAEPEVLVLDGTEINFMHDALKRIACPFRHAARLDPASLGHVRLFILAGKSFPDGAAKPDIIGSYLRAGGHVLAIGGGAKWMLDARLFDAEGYYPTGTTIHQSTFDGYHRLTFGYPCEKPHENWTAGVPMLLRATEGPLMRLGPRATSILAAGGPFSLAAFQRVGKGIALLIGPDPQGGNEYLSLTKPTPQTGAKLGTDTLLANAIAWLLDPACNLIPNGGFEENTALPAEKSHWQITLLRGATSKWDRREAPEGEVFLQLACPPRGSASVTPFRPIVVERGTRHRFTCRLKSTGACALEIRHLKQSSDEPARQAPQRQTLPASPNWSLFETVVATPNNASYLSITALISQPGELCLDEIKLRQIVE